MNRIIRLLAVISEKVWLRERNVWALRRRMEALASENDVLSVRLKALESQVAEHVKPSEVLAYLNAMDRQITSIGETCNTFQHAGHPDPYASLLAANIQAAIATNVSWVRMNLRHERF